jgi:transcriptional regulator with XRE-family HTH domain
MTTFDYDGLSLSSAPQNALAKATGIPASTLQGYEAGAKPRMDALIRLARVGNVDFNWLITGRGEIKSPGQISGAAFADIVMVNQQELGTALSMSIVIRQYPYLRSSQSTAGRV